MNNKYTTAKEVKTVKTWGTEEGKLTIEDGVYTMAAYSSVMFSTLGYHNHLSLTVTTADKADRFGISFVRGDRKDGDSTYEKYYSVMVCPDGDNNYIRFEEEQGKWELKGGGSYVFPVPANRTYHIDIYILKGWGADEKFAGETAMTDGDDYKELALTDDLRTAMAEADHWMVQFNKEALDAFNVTDIVLIEKVAQGVENAAVNAQAVKCMVDGQLIILRDGKSYNVLGTTLR